jgi:hypothetical protein
LCFPLPWKLIGSYLQNAYTWRWVNDLINSYCLMQVLVVAFKNKKLPLPKWVILLVVVLKGLGVNYNLVACLVMVYESILG